MRILRTVFLAAVLLLASPVFFFAQGDNGKITITAKDEKFSCSIQKASFVNAMDTLFSKGGREYALLSKPNISLDGLTSMLPGELNTSSFMKQDRSVRPK